MSNWSDLNDKPCGFIWTTARPDVSHGCNLRDGHQGVHVCCSCKVTSALVRCCCCGEVHSLGRPERGVLGTTENCPPLIWAETEFEFPGRHEEFKKMESHVGGWVVEEMPAKYGGTIRLTNELDLTCQSVPEAKTLAQRLQNDISTPSSSAPTPETEG